MGERHPEDERGRRIMVTWNYVKLCKKCKELKLCASKNSKVCVDCINKNYDRRKEENGKK